MLWSVASCTGNFSGEPSPGGLFLGIPLFFLCFYWSWVAFPAVVRALGAGGGKATRSIVDCEADLRRLERDKAANDSLVRSYDSVRLQIESFLNERRPHRTVPFYGSAVVGWARRAIEGHT